MPQDLETISVYDEKAGEYLEKFVKNKIDPSLASFMSRLPAGGSVLDLGCGPGNSAAIMSDAGFNVTATDASKTMVELAARHEGVNAKQASFEELDEIGTYDGVWANFSLLHAKRTDFPRYLQKVSNALKQGGILHLGMKTGESEGRDSLGRFYAYYSLDELADHLSAAGLSIVDEVKGKQEGLAGNVEPWIILTANKK